MSHKVVSNAPEIRSDRLFALFLSCFVRVQRHARAASNEEVRVVTVAWLLAGTNRVAHAAVRGLFGLFSALPASRPQVKSTQLNSAQLDFADLLADASALFDEFDLDEEAEPSVPAVRAKKRATRKAPRDDLSVIHAVSAPVQVKVSASA